MADLDLVTVVSVSIAAPPARVVAYVGDGSNLTRWASGLAEGHVERAGDEWVVTGPLGAVRVRFAPPNDFGVLDHVVTLPDGEKADNPVRVIANRSGSTISFHVFRRAGQSADDHAKDVAHVEQDLHTLRGILERQ